MINNVYHTPSIIMAIYGSLVALFVIYAIKANKKRQFLITSGLNEKESAVYGAVILSIVTSGLVALSTAIWMFLSVPIIAHILYTMVIVAVYVTISWCIGTIWKTIISAHYDTTIKR